MPITDRSRQRGFTIPLALRLFLGTALLIAFAVGAAAFVTYMQGRRIADQAVGKALTTSAAVQREFEQHRLERSVFGGLAVGIAFDELHRLLERPGLGHAGGFEESVIDHCVALLRNVRADASGIDNAARCWRAVSSASLELSPMQRRLDLLAATWPRQVWRMPKLTIRTWAVGLKICAATLYRDPLKDWAQP